MEEPDPPSDPPQGKDLELDLFIKDLTESQGNLRAYLLAALGNYEDAAEVLQKTNLALWRNTHRFQPGTDFVAWAITLARYELQSYYRDRSRDRHVFSEEVATMMLQTAAQDLPDLSDRQVALRQCVAGLNAKSREILKLKYDAGASIASIAQQLKKTENAVKSSLLRVRKALERCIESRLNSDTI